jgi:hypothetical protein
MHSISRFRARLATVLSLRRLSFSMEPIRIPPDRTFESVFLQGRVTTNHRFRRRFLLAVPLVRILFPPAESPVRTSLGPMRRQSGRCYKKLRPHLEHDVPLAGVAKEASLPLRVRCEKRQAAEPYR